MVGLLDPLKIDELSLENRIVLPPMQTQFADKDGKVTDELIGHYVERTSVGLLIVEHGFANVEGKYARNQLGIHDDELIPGLEKLVDGVHERDCPIAIQINHAGKRISERDVQITPVAPSAEEGVRKLDANHIENIIEDFVKGARRADRAGFDAIEIHGAHGFLLNQFFSPLSNRRSDEYGGSFENRIRLPLQIVERIKEDTEKPLLYRLGSDDLDPNGINIDDSVRFAERLVEAGIDILDISGGMCGSRPDELAEEQGYFVSQAKEIKNEVDVPVIGVGGISEPEYADMIVREGLVDLVAVGRAQLGNPNWAREAIEKLERR